jgi:uncharacterized delta-60 repeat protein
MLAAGMQQLLLSKRVLASMKASILALAALLLCWAAPAGAAPGDLDSSFGHRGLVHTHVAAIGYAGDIGLQPDGRIVVAGDADLQPNFDARLGYGKLDFAVARYTARGQLDRKFASRGFATLALGGEDHFSALDAEPYQTMLGGQSRVPGTPFTYGVFALARFDSLGRPDPSFGQDGWVTIPETAGLWSTVAALHRGQSGETVAIGPIDPLQPTQDLHRKLGFVHLYPDGTPDLNFAPGGTKIVAFNGNNGDARSFLLDSRGGVLVAGIEPQDFKGVSPVVVQRFSLDGVPDPGFGTNGVARIGFTRGTTGAMALQADGSVIVSIGGDTYHPARLARISPAGALDRTFGKNGVVAAVRAISSIAVDRDSRIVVSDPAFQLTRYKANGALDRTFKGAVLPRRWRGGEGTAIAITRSGDIVAAGGMTPGPLHSDDFAPTEYDFGVARFHGGDDVTPPRIAVRRASGGCLRGGLRVRVGDKAGPVSLHVSVDGRRVLEASRKRALIRLSPGRHRVVIRAQDSSDNVSVKKLHVRRCAAPADA